jgi:hypothetical protein
VQVSLEELTKEFKKRMNEPEEAPPSFKKSSCELVLNSSRKCPVPIRMCPRGKVFRAN